MKALTLVTAALIVSLTSSLTHAEESKMTPSLWTRGFHFAAGGLLSTSLSDSSIENADLGWGGGARTDMGYYFNSNIALEISSTVTMSRLNGLLFWDSLFTLALRHRLPFFADRDLSASYLRLFGGRGPLVVVFEREKPAQYEVTGAQRLQLEGPVFGGGFGITQKTASENLWYMEVMVTTHRFETLEVVKSDGDVPLVIAQSTPAGVSHIVAVHFLIGIFAF